MRSIAPIFPAISSQKSRKFATFSGLRFAIRRCEEAQTIRHRDLLLHRGATVVRILALPLLLIGFTGWIPNEGLKFEAKGPWPWGAIISLILIIGSLVGIFCRREKTSKALSPNSPKLPS
jgi:hypothetical protein